MFEKNFAFNLCDLNGGYKIPSRECPALDFRAAHSTKDISYGWHFYAVHVAYGNFGKIAFWYPPKGDSGSAPDLYNKETLSITINSSLSQGDQVICTNVTSETKHQQRYVNENVYIVRGDTDGDLLYCVLITIIFYVHL